MIVDSDVKPQNKHTNNHERRDLNLEHCHPKSRALLVDHVDAFHTKNVFSGIFGQQRPRSACASAQSDQGLRCPHTESLDTIECSSGEEMLGLDLHMRRMNLCAFCVCLKDHFLSVVPIYSLPYLIKVFGTDRSKQFKAWPRGLELFSCSTQLSMKFVLKNLKITITENSFSLKIAEHENFSANKYFCWHFHIYQQKEFHSQLS